MPPAVAASAGAALPPAPAAPASTPWTSVLLAIGAGVLAGVQVGKAHIALGSIRSSFSLDLVSASWILSAISFVGLFVATPVGSFAARIGNKRTVAAGLAIIAVSSAAGAFASDAAWLVASRVAEGAGFVMVVVAAPSLIVQITRPQDLRLALAGWAAFMPGGVALATITAPLILSSKMWAGQGWRTLWLADAAVVAAFVLMLAVGVPKVVSAGAKYTMHPFRDLRVVMTARGPVFLALIFAMYTLQHLGIMGLLPTVLIENHHVPPADAGVLVSIAMAANILGNVAAGLLLQRGLRRSVLIGGATLFMALMTVGMFAAHLPTAGVYACAFLFSCVGGLVPGAVISGAPYHAPGPQLIPAVNGLLVQGSNLGIVLGPPLISAIAMTAGWGWVPALTVAGSLVATTLAVLLNRSVPSSRGSWFIEERDHPLPQNLH